MKFDIATFVGFLFLIAAIIPKKGELGVYLVIFLVFTIAGILIGAVSYMLAKIIKHKKTK